MHVKGVFIIFLLLATQLLSSQPIYFNESFNPNSTWAIGSSIVCNDGLYYFSGVTDDTVFGYSTFLSKIDSHGNIQFWKNYGDKTQAYYAGYTGSLIYSSKEELALGGFIGFNTNDSKGVLYRFQPNGSLISITEYPDTSIWNWTQFTQCKQTHDSGYVLVGNTTVGSYNANLLIVKTDSLGNELWRKDYERGGIDHGYSIIQTPDKGYFIGYFKYWPSGMSEPSTIKIDSIGSIEWEVDVGGPFPDYMPFVTMGNDGNYICGTSVTDTMIGDNLFTRTRILKISPDGDIIWSKTIGKLELDNILYSIRPDHSGGYIACGLRNDYFNPNGMFFNTYGWILRINEDGDSTWYREYRHFTDSSYHKNYLYDVSLAYDGGYIAVGQTADNYNPQHVWIIKLDSIGCDTPDCNMVGLPESIKITKEIVEIYPIPTSDHLTIKINSIVSESLSCHIYDILGNPKGSINLPQNQSTISLNTSAYKPGMYILFITDRNGLVFKGKFLVSN